MLDRRPAARASVRRDVREHTPHLYAESSQPNYVITPWAAGPPAGDVPTSSVGRRRTHAHGTNRVSTVRTARNALTTEYLDEK